RDLDNLNSTLGPFSSFRCTEFGVTCDGKTIARAAAHYDSCQARGDSYLYGAKRYIDFLTSLRPASHLFVAAIAGNAAPFDVALDAHSHPALQFSCSSASGNAVPAVRLRDVVAAFAGHGSFTSLCADDYSAPFAELGKQLRAALTAACLKGTLR